MTPWRWWWLEEGGDEHGGWCGDCATREDAIASARRELGHGASFFVMEARSSSAAEYEGSDCVPFLRTRNRELLVSGVRSLSGKDEVRG